MGWRMDKLGPYKLNSIVMGDARELAKAIPDNSVDFVLWDPDYGVGMDYGPTSLSADQAIEDLLAILTEMKRASKTGQAVIFWSGSLGRIKILFKSGIEDIWPLYYFGIWYKPNSAGPTGNGLARRFETWFWLKDGKKPVTEWRFLPDVLKVNRVVPGHIEAVAHPSQKPIDLLVQLIRFFTKPGDIVVDPTIGSGSTAVACILTGRQFLGFELNPEYIEIAQQRIANTQPPLFVPETVQVGMAI